MLRAIIITGKFSHTNSLCFIQNVAISKQCVCLIFADLQAVEMCGVNTFDWKLFSG